MSGKERPAPQPLAARLDRGLPMVAIVGRPNVGKSTLFNRLVGRRLAIVEDVPGVTRDRHYAHAFVNGREFILIDTGGFDPESDDPMSASIADQVRLALEECDIVICVLDATADPTPADAQAIDLLRRTVKPTIYVANKADSRARVHSAMSHYQLGIDEILPVSALHALGIGDLEDALAPYLPEPRAEEEEAPVGTPAIAIIGRPNAGKSSLSNRLIGKERQLVDDRPGTTVDSIDTLITLEGEPYVLIDTAGMRRRRSVERGVESLSVIAGIRAIERSDVAVLLLDGATGVVEQDAKIAGLAVDRGRALVVGLNKIDCMDKEALKKAKERLREVLAFAPWAEIVHLSAKTGRNVHKLQQAITRALSSHRQRITTGEVNRFFREVLETHPPPATRGHRPVRLYYITQVQIAPPTFVIVTNEPQGVHFSYQRYVVNQLRQRFGFDGSPIRVKYRGRSGRRGQPD